MTNEIIDQQQLNDERIGRNARLFELGVLALSSREQAEIKQKARLTSIIVLQAESIIFAAEVESDYGTFSSV